MKDALGWRKKFAVLGPSTNTIVQPDFDDMRPFGVTNHYSRIFTPNASAVSNDSFMKGARLIGNNTIDYLAKATLAATAKGQGGRDAKDVAGITIPIKLTGALDNPNWNVDYSGLLGSGGGGITETIKKGAGGVGDSVRGLFRR